MHVSRKLSIAAALAALLLIGLVLLTCQGTPSRSDPVPTVTNQTLPSTSPPPTAVVLVVTREVIRQVAVTVTPSPTPAYVSLVEAPPHTLLYPLPDDVQSVDPQEAASEASLLVASQLYEDLFYLQRDGSLAPGAATSYRSSANGQVFTVTLRSGLTWSIGQAVDATDYVTGTCRLLAPGVGNPRKTLLTDAARLVGAAEFASGARPDCSRVGITAVDPRTLQFTLERALPSFPQLLAGHLFLPALPSGSQGTVAEPAASTSLTVTRPSTGAYVLAEWRPGQSVTLVKNPRYWDAEHVNIARIEMPLLPDPGGQLAAYQAGRLHVANVPDRSVLQTESDSAFKRELHLLPLPGTSYLGINTALTPTSDIHFRQALAVALDRQALLSDVLHEPWHQAAFGLVPPGLPGTPLAPQPSAALTRTAAARTLLAQAGYGVDNPAPVVTLWANNEGHNQALAIGIAGALQRSGIDVRVMLSNWDVYHRSLEECRQTASSGDAGNKEPVTSGGPDCGYNLYLAGWLMDASDPGRILGLVQGERPATAYSNWLAKDYGELIDRAQGTSDSRQRAGFYNQAGQMLLDQVVVLPLFYYDRTVAVKPGVTYDFPEFGPPVFKYWQLAR